MHLFKSVTTWKFVAVVRFYKYSTIKLPDRIAQFENFFAAPHFFIIWFFWDCDEFAKVQNSKDTKKRCKILTKKASRVISRQVIVQNFCTNNSFRQYFSCLFSRFFSISIFSFDSEYQLFKTDFLEKIRPNFLRTTQKVLFQWIIFFLFQDCFKFNKRFFGAKWVNSSFYPR